MATDRVDVPYSGPEGLLSFFLTLKKLSEPWAMSNQPKALEQLDWYLTCLGARINPLKPRPCEKCGAKSFAFVRVQSKLICQTCVEHFLIQHSTVR